MPALATSMSTPPSCSVVWEMSCWTWRDRDTHAPTCGLLSPARGRRCRRAHIHTHLVAIGHIAVAEGCTDALLLQVGDRSRCRRVVDIRHHHRCALLAKALRYRVAYASGGSRDDGNLGEESGRSMVGASLAHR